MKSEIIYRESTSSRGRYGNKTISTIMVSSNFDNPVNWPFTVTIEIISEHMFSNESDVDTENYRISKDAFFKIKQIIAENIEIASCSENINNSVMDGSSESYYFSCDSFSKSIGGMSIYSIGYYEQQKPNNQKTDNYKVFVLVNKIKEILRNEGII